MRILVAASLLIVALSACGGEADPDPSADAQSPTASDAGPASEPTEATAAGNPIEAMNEAIAALNAKSEHGADSVEVEHILVGMKSSNPRMAAFKYDAAGAEKFAADLYQQIQGGADFGELRKAHSDDPGPGIYPMDVNSRRSMVPAFGNVAWKLEVGEVGIAPYDATASPFGIHIIKRLK